MKFVILLLMSFSSFAGSCFLVKESHKVLKEEGKCHQAFAPNSTFKIPLAIMGFDSEILHSMDSPVFSFKGQKAWMSVCQGDHNPREWMRDSCVWFSQVLAQKIGLEKFGTYIEKFNYGNKNLKGKEAITRSWLENTLRISPHEQVQFLTKFLQRELTVSPKAYDFTTHILYHEELAGGWKLYGKTGNGRYQGELQHGWFVGWMEKKGRKIVFAYHLTDERKQDVYASFRAKNEVTNKLWYLINDLEKESTGPGDK